MTICYFTATGNCLYVARRIGGKLLSMEAGTMHFRNEHVTLNDIIQANE